jgi:hypothetical protein
MAPPKKPTMRDIAKEDRVSPAEALGELLVTAKESMLSAARDIPGELTELDGVPVPARKDIETADAATAWAQEQILKATPRAVQEVIYQLKRGGTAKERAAMALQILDRAGVKEKDGPKTIAPVFILSPEAVKDLPWVKKAQELGKVVQNQISNASAKEIIDAEIVKNDDSSNS